MVRPWKAPWAATSLVRPVSRVSLKATSLASAPELQKNTRAGTPRWSDESLGERDTGFGGVQVGDVTQGVELRGDGLDDRRVPVAEDVDRDAAQQIEVLAAVDVGHHSTVAGLASASGGVP